ncbi:glutamate synthase-related protein [Pelolinea submarina]|uniref:Glutamate synthase (Ferredoxin) n=1 Tax=Pelolinea submarina TaxID=913107 RepID=A0A347ZTL8_9CHLR|nr:glutamate synthase-related protein [Pelolinea submarina]REG10773.1 glutamate synthase (ferredoxin) [Pelolinea submarina]BBB48649.1 glutamate synthase (NADPH/NADH) large chain [Pelolinea submarina]
MSIKPIRTDVSPDSPYGPEHDSCALYLSARKNGQSTFGTLKRALWRLANMGHRTGYVRGEGDGAGVQTDIPRSLWAKKLSQAGLPASLATQTGFWVGHLFIPFGMDYTTVQASINREFDQAGLNLLLAEPGPVRCEALGLNAQTNPPAFWQLAGSANLPDLENRLFVVKQNLERELPIHFASLSSYTVIYKMRGSVETLARYYPELQDRSYDTVMVLCHARYSTNTVSTFERAQPFALLGHNGEINTINRFRQEARQIGVQLPRDGSDSQDVDRALEHFCINNNFNLMEAMEIVFPPSPFEIDQLTSPLSDIYTRMTLAFGAFAQGPAAIAARYGDTAVCSLDTLGLRPLWFSETEKEFIFSSERGAIQLEDMVTDSRPLAPGEKMGLVIHRGRDVEVLSHRKIRQQVMNTNLQRSSSLAALSSNSPVSLDSQFGQQIQLQSVQQNSQQSNAAYAVQNTSSARVLFSQNSALSEKLTIPFNITEPILAAAGWSREQVDDVKQQALSGHETVGSLGYDGPLAALSRNRVNLSDYFKETVAVVTNPAIDRGREGEAFSTRVILGQRPEIASPSMNEDSHLLLSSPLLSSRLPGSTDDTHVSSDVPIYPMEAVGKFFGHRMVWLSLAVPQGQSFNKYIDKLTQAAVEAVKAGALCLVLDDSIAIADHQCVLDPVLAVAAVDDILRKNFEPKNLRRQTGIIVRSTYIRCLHDIVMLCSFGADAVNPYAMLSIAADTAGEDSAQAITNLLQSLQVGLEKVISTIGSHELRGYGRVASSIGLAPELAGIFHTANFLGSHSSGLSWQALEQDAQNRREILEMSKAHSGKLASIDHLYPHFWKAVGSYTSAQGDYQDIVIKYRDLTSQTPVALRHLIDFKTSPSVLSTGQVNIEIGEHAMPLVISAMSFGSQGEAAYSTYARAADKLNIICINGEGGEVPELIGKYKRNRGQQVASGRFGVNAEFLNSCGLIEIKIGQGAKPGEGGMLPAEKVNPRVAQARRTPPFVALLSPSNNHDLYSIEDLAQLIEELRTVNPHARIGVKCPCVPGIGVIAVGVAKAGADVINLSGYDGATGAARKHAIQHVGLPVEIGVVQAHRALVEAGIRDRVEIWCDGGIKTGADVLKMILLGANRVGFATLAMVAIGCTICRKCNQGTCHKGITTHIKTLEEAQKLGIKDFTPLDMEASVIKLERLFNGIGEELRQLTAALGVSRVQDLVGKADLLEQSALNDRIDLSAMLEPVPVRPYTKREPGIGRLLTRDRNHLTRFISETVLEAVDEGETEVTYQDQVMAYDRALGSHLFGALMRHPQLDHEIDQLHLHFSPSSIGGNGFAAWITGNMDVLIEGGAQDGAAKGANGGRVAIMKGLNHDGLRIDGSVGKSFAYGAQQGILLVQGNADSRACIRLSGADVVLGGQITHPIDDNAGSVGTSANLKGYACEYMTSGRVIILGDPGPWAFSGMTGGVVYQLLTPEMGFTLDVLERRLGIGAQVNILPVEGPDILSIQELLKHYHQALLQTNQPEYAEQINQFCLPQVALSRFVKIVPRQITPVE